MFRNIKSKILFFIIFLLYAEHSFCQSQNGDIKGTILIGGIASDGVVIAADSRAGITDKSGQVVAYIDSVPKIYIIGAYPVAIAGSYDIGNKIVQRVTQEYSKNNMAVNQDMKNIFKRLQYYLLSSHIDTMQIFFGGGYFGNKATVIDISSNHFRTETGGYIFNDTDVTRILKIYNDKIHTSEELRKIFEKVIYTVARENKKEDVVGGPISIVKILKNNKIVWLQNDFSNMRPKNYTALVDLIKAGKRKLTLMPNHTREEVIGYMESNPKYNH